MKTFLITCAWLVLFRTGPAVAGNLPGDDAAPQQPGADTAPAKVASVVGTWRGEERHLAMGSLFQPVHGTRLRYSDVHFRQQGERLIGFSETPDHDGISFNEHWKGRTDFRDVTFANGRLVFEFDIEEVNHGWGRQTKSKGWIRVEAELKRDRLIGTWGLFEKQKGAELFRGEWEAVRAKLTAPHVADLPGPFLLIGGRHQDLADDLRAAFFDLAGGNKAKIVVIPTGVAHADDPKSADEFLKPWQDLKPLSAVVLHTRDRKKADDPAFVKPLDEATAVFFTNGHLDRIFNAYRGTLVARTLKKLHERGGLIGGAGTGAMVLSELVIARPDQDGLTEPGLGLLPGFLIEDGRRIEPISEALASNPAYVGLTIEPGAAVELRGKNLRVIGQGTATVRLAKGAGLESKIDTLKSGTRLDLLELRRAAARRAEGKNR